MNNQNQTAHQNLLEERKLRLVTIKLGGGLKNIQKQHERGKLIARERIDYLIDNNTEFLEMGVFVGYEMYEEHSGCTVGKEEDEILKQIMDRYSVQTTPYYVAARLWVDEIIDPLDTRKVISKGIEAANHAPITKGFKVSIFQV